MNNLEKKMVDLLTDLRDNCHVTGIKAEFEAEGTRMEEAMRLKDVTGRAGLSLNIKVGGCEALKDMFDCIALGADRIIAPMVETPFALKKFILASHIAFPGDLRTNVQRLINVETITTIRNLDDMLAIPEAKDLNGIVIGRVDLTGSLGLSREQINSQQILDLSLAAAAKAKAKGLDVIVGGGVSAHSRDFFAAFPPGHLDRYETRKVIFQCPGALSNPEAAFLKAVEFELYWLKNKKAYYGTIFGEDDARIEMLEKRYRQSINATK